MLWVGFVELHLIYEAESLITNGPFGPFDYGGSLLSRATHQSVFLYIGKSNC